MTISQRARAHRSIALACVLGLALAACGSDESSSASSVQLTVTTDADASSTDAPAATDASVTSDAPASTDTPAGTDASSTAFPVNIPNMFGTTVIESKPERVASIGYTEGDFILALGVTPVGIREWYGDLPGALWPWAAESPAASLNTTTVFTSETLDAEAVAATKPDLIVAIVSEITQADYDKLTQIAPVIAQTDEYVQFGTPWSEVQLTIGKALGLETEAQAIVDDINDQIAAVGDAHPDWAGKTANFSVIGPDGSWYSYTDQDNRGRLLTELGFSIPQTVLDAAGDLFYAEGTQETIGIIDADLLMYTAFTEADRPTVEALPLFAAVPAVADKHAIYADDILAGAMSFSTTLSIPYALENIVPEVEAALG